MTDTDTFLARVADYFLGRGEPADLWSHDVVIEAPFAPAGRQKRYQGRQQFLDATRQARESLPVRIEEFRDVTVHDAGASLVIEYELAGTVLATGAKSAARFITVVELREGKATLWREYQDTLAMAEALG
jgi:uncharacterized protein